MYDIAIVGAGINGCSVAYEFISAKKSVILFDIKSIAGGGSGAAGAFISPKFSKAGELKKIIDSAFTYSMKFYENNFSHLFEKSMLKHTLQDGSETFSLEAGVVNAEAVCNALAKGSTFIKSKVDSIYFDDGAWILNDNYMAKELVLSTGAYEQIIDEPYMKLRGIWGHRVDIKTSTENEDLLHQFVSISPNKNGVISIGATHNVHYHPQKNPQAYDFEEGRKELLDKASKMLDLDNCQIIKDYVGLRSGSFDYIPILGPLVISKETLANKNIHFQTKKPKYEEYEYYPHLNVINGNGGYGFVLAPYLSKKLSLNILSARPIDKQLLPARFFARWAKKLQ